MSKIGDVTIERVCLTWPAYGQAQGEVSTLTGSIPAGPVALRIADLTFAVSVVPGRAGLDGPEAWRGVVRAGMGWGTELGELHATYGGGPVKLSTILQHLAAECGERIELPADVIVGTSFARPVSLPGLPFTGADLLSLLRERRVTGPWRVDTDGVTRFGVRPSTTVDPRRYAVLARSLSAGYRKISVTALAGIVPGAILDGAVIGRLIITEDAGSLMCETYER
ncbi:MAG: hypothetical protein WCJ30_11185 [Deltaproteobacteria bacterium]